MSSAAGGSSRRVFLGRAAGAAAAVAGASVGAGALARSAGAADQRTYTAGRFALDLDGVTAGKLAGVDGGDLIGNVVVEDPQPGAIARGKHIGGVKWEDFTVQVGSGMGAGIYEWMRTSTEKGPEPRRASIAKYDAGGNERSRRGASQALITSVTVPALDRTAKTGYSAYLALGLEIQGSTGVVKLPTKGTLYQSAGKQKAWLTNNFVLEIDGIDTSRVASIDSFTWKCSIAADGSFLMDVSDIGVTFDQSSSSSWRDWCSNAIRVGGDERSGALTLIGANGGAVMTFDLSNLCAYRFYGVPHNGQATGRMKAELYCERMRLLPTVNK